MQGGGGSGMSGDTGLLPEIRKFNAHTVGLSATQVEYEVLPIWGWPHSGNDGGHGQKGQCGNGKDLKW